MTSIVRFDNLSTVAGTGTITVDAGNTLDTSAGLVTPAGHVIQVVEGVKTSISGTTSTSLVATGITASITPTSSTSKILVAVYLNGVYVSGSTTAALFELYRNGSSIAYLNDITAYHAASGANHGESTAISFLDSPSATSELTYEIYARSSNGNQLYINNYYSGANRTRSTITLMEIAG